jgi:hypothetical protein
MRFLRHDGIYRSDVSLLLVNPAQVPPPVGRPRCQAIVRDGRSTPCPSSAMSSGRLFLDRGGRHQSPSPLRRYPHNKSLALRRASNYHRTASSVLTVCVSRGDKRIPGATTGLTRRDLSLLPAPFARLPPCVSRPPRTGVSRSRRGRVASLPSARASTATALPAKRAPQCS